MSDFYSLDHDEQASRMTALADRALWGGVADLPPDEPFSLAGLAAQGF